MDTDRQTYSRIDTCVFVFVSTKINKDIVGKKLAEKGLLPPTKLNDLLVCERVVTVFK